MTRDETLRIIKILELNYQKFWEKLQNKENLETAIDIWQEALKDTNYNTSLKAIKKLILNKKEIPTIYDVKKIILEIKKEQTEEEAWDKAYKIINKGIYMSQKEFNNLDPEFKNFFRNLENLKRISKSKTNIVNTKIKSKFLEYYNK